MNFDIRKIAEDALTELYGDEYAKMLLKKLDETEFVNTPDDRIKIPARKKGLDNVTDLLKEVSNLVHARQFTAALNLLEYIEKEGYEPVLQRYIPMIDVNDKRKWIYWKLKDKNREDYYTSMYHLGELVNDLYNADFKPLRYFYTAEFLKEFENKEYREAAKELIGWIKPLKPGIQKLYKVEVEIKNDIYMYCNDKDSRDLDAYVRTKNEKFNMAFDAIDLKIKQLFVLK